jgi:hypothetical protein
LNAFDIAYCVIVGMASHVGKASQLIIGHISSYEEKIKSRKEKNTTHCLEWFWVRVGSLVGSTCLKLIK